MASEDSLAHFFQRSKTLPAVAVRIHGVSLFHDPDQALSDQVLLAFYHLDDLAKPFEGRPLAAERHHVPFEERDHLLNEAPLRVNSDA